jgi:hypothetical protein
MRVGRLAKFEGKLAFVVDPGNNRKHLADYVFNQRTFLKPDKILGLTRKYVGRYKKAL